MQITIPSKTIKVYQETDVLVIGGGPAGIGAALAAARSGKKTALLEKRGFLGGNITGAYVETCNGFLRTTSYQPRGIYAELVRDYRAQFGNSHDIRVGAPHRFSSEYLKIFLDVYLQKAGVTLYFHSFVNEVVMDGAQIASVIIQSKQGPVAFRAKTYIDCSGDGDVAFAAGVPFDQGRDTDNLCQPGTTAFRITGVDARRFIKDGRDGLRDIINQFKEAYDKKETGLSCVRRSLPFGRLTPAGQITYINYPCAYKIDPTSFADLSRGEMENRVYILEMLEYMKKHFEGFENIELTSIATEIGFRDSRRIHGEYRLTIQDMEANRHFDDVISTFPRFYDMLTPDPDNMDGDGGVEHAGYKGHIHVLPENDRTFEIPYRSLLPVGVENLIIAGRCISADHVAESGIRAVMACMYTGQAAGTAAGIAQESALSPKEISIPLLQAALRKQELLDG